ncbi:hsp70-like protein [Paramyrothecium foliicola]|nr:hsp70-like protein [Paramyrothecium foliicola]
MNESSTGIAMKKKKKASLQDARYISPYASTMVELQFQDQYPLNVHADLLRKSPVLYGQYLSGTYVTNRRLKLNDISYSVGHTMVHFLFTGTYERPKETENAANEDPDLIIDTAFQAYHAAQKYKLTLLAELAKDDIYKLGAQLDLPRLIKAIESEFSGGSHLDAWLSAYLIEKIQSLNIESATCLANETDNQPSLQNVIFRGALKLFSGLEPGLDFDTPSECVTTETIDVLEGEKEPYEDEGERGDDFYNPIDTPGNDSDSEHDQTLSRA